MWKPGVWKPGEGVRACAIYVPSKSWTLRKSVLTSVFCICYLIARDTTASTLSRLKLISLPFPDVCWFPVAIAGGAACLRGLARLSICRHVFVLLGLLFRLAEMKHLQQSLWVAVQLRVLCCS